MDMTQALAHTQAVIDSIEAELKELAQQPQNELTERNRLSLWNLKRQLEQTLTRYQTGDP